MEKVRKNASFNADSVESVGQILRDHIDYRKQIIKLAISALRKTYRATALGWAWAIIKPVFTVLVYWFAFAFGLRHGGDVEGFPFVLWLICGVIPWFFISEMITGGAACIVRNRYLVTKMKFPVSIIPTFTTLSHFIVHVALEIIVVLIFALTGHFPTVYLLQLPFYMLCNFLFCAGWAFLSAPIAAVSEDFLNLVRSLVTAVFWFSGILWNPDKMDNPIARRLLMINPVTFLTTGYRNCFIYNRWFFEQPRRLMYFVIELAFIYTVGYLCYRHCRREMADVL